MCVVLLMPANFMRPVLSFSLFYGQSIASDLQFENSHPKYGKDSFQFGKEAHILPMEAGLRCTSIPAWLGEFYSWSRMGLLSPAQMTPASSWCPQLWVSQSL